MKRHFLRFLSITGLFALITFYAAAQNGRKYTQPVYATFENESELVLSSGTDLHLTVEIEKPADARSVTVLPVGEESNGTVVVGRTSSRKDGKVDVDIIIRTLNLGKLGLIPDITVIPPKTKLHLFTIEVITVDNISGISVGDDKPANGGTLARMSSISLKDSEGSTIQPNVSPSVTVSGPSTSEQARIPVQTVQSPDISLFPVPVREGLLNISIPAAVGAVQSVSIHNLLGARIRQFQPAFSGGIMQLNLNDIGNGVYFLRMKTETGEVVRKFSIGQ